MHFHTATWLTAGVVLTGVACAGSGRNQSSGAAPIDTVHIRTADTMPAAGGAGAMRTDTATHDSAGRAVPDNAQQDSIKRSGADSVP